jgi:DNA-binding GntR family transcriptional regulator
MNSLDHIIERLSGAGNAAETAYAVLREAIVTNALKPGTRLRAEELARQIGVSKTPVREALRKLQAEELVTAQTGNAPVVKVLTEQNLFEIYQTREALEGMAARLAAKNAGPVELSRLDLILDEMEQALRVSNLQKLRALIGEFQLAMFQAGRNDTLFRLLKSLQDQMRQHSSSTITQRGRAKEYVLFAKRLLSAVKQRNADQAEALARANRRRTLELRIKMLLAAD